MNNDIIEGNWKKFTGEIQKQWGKLTDDNLSQVDGDRKKLAKLIQENYNIAHEEAEKQIRDLEESLKS